MLGLSIISLFATKHIKPAIMEQHAKVALSNTTYSGIAQAEKVNERDFLVNGFIFGFR